MDFRIKFYNKNGMPDAEAAKRAYDWCKENCDWFKYSGTTLYRFSLNENQ